jgi:gamma-glutamyltranspeptidase/glutathione hydrolase
MVSLIQSNYRGMGSGMVPPKLGFMLQDRGSSDLSEAANHHMLSKRPFHTIIPGLSKDSIYEFWRNGWRFSAARSCTSANEPN